MMDCFLQTGFVLVKHVNICMGDKCKALLAESSKELVWNNCHLGDNCKEYLAKPPQNLFEARGICQKNRRISCETNVKNCLANTPKNLLGCDNHLLQRTQEEKRVILPPRHLLWLRTSKLTLLGKTGKMLRNWETNLKNWLGNLPHNRLEPQNGSARKQNQTDREIGATLVELRCNHGVTLVNLPQNLLRQKLLAAQQNRLRQKLWAAQDHKSGHHETWKTLVERWCTLAGTLVEPWPLKTPKLDNRSTTNESNPNYFIYL